MSKHVFLGSDPAALRRQNVEYRSEL